jgi:hypothetical protein
MKVVKGLELTYFDKNGATFNMDRVSSDWLNCLAATILPRGHIKLGAVPGTGDNFAVQTSFDQGARAVRANVADSVKRAIHIK